MIGFDQIAGQDHAIDWIRRAFEADRLPHGLIFAGPIGVGKATAAFALAALFLCRQPNGSNPCGVCESCRLMQAGNHPDFHVVVKELIRFHDKTGKSKGTELSISVIRAELVDKANLKSAMGRGKVFIVEQAELMNPPAQNALLKTLEEPAGRTLIILITDMPGLLLATIRSRCQTVRFASLDPRMVQDELARRGIAADVAADAARLAGGSLGLALKWLEEGVIDNARQLLSQLRQIASGGDATGLPAWFKKAADAYAGKQLERDELASKDQANREGLGLYLRLAADYYRHGLMELSGKQAAADALERQCAAIDAIARAETYLDANVNISLIFQQLAMALARLGK